MEDMFMANAADGYDASIKGADRLAKQILPAQLDLLQLFLPMDCWMVGRRDGKRLEVVATQGEADGVSAICMRKALASDRLSSSMDGRLHRWPDLQACRMAPVCDQKKASCPKYVFKAFLPDRHGNLTGVVAGFLFREEGPREVPLFCAPVIMLCLNTMAHALSLQADLAMADKLMLKAQQGARIDPLTGVLNRAGWGLALSGARKAAGEIAVAFLDLDDFKRINDTRGHQAGDDVLKITARAVRKSLRSHDCVARLGGDEFAMLLPDTSLADACSLGERLCWLLGKRGIMASIGVAAKSETGSLQKALALADARMYESKQQRTHDLETRERRQTM